MKILHTIAGGAAGGAERFFVDLSIALHNAGHDTRAVMRPNAARGAMLREAGVPFTGAPFRNWLDFGTRRTIRSVSNEMKSDVVLAWMGRAARATPADGYIRAARLGGYYNLKAFAGYDALICNTPDLVHYVTEGGYAASRVHFIPNFAPVDDRPPLDRAAFDTPEGVPLLLAMGRLHDAKAFDVTLKALADIPEAILWIAGSGPLEDDLKKLAADIGVAPRVRWLGWRDDPGRLLRTADICVFPSRTEPFGNVIIAAWAHGTPVVTAAATGPQWLVRAEDDALLVPINDASAVAHAANRLIADPALGKRLAEAGAKRAEAEFSEAACVGRYVSLFEQLQQG